MRNVVFGADAFDGLSPGPLPMTDSANKSVHSVTRGLMMSMDIIKVVDGVYLGLRNQSMSSTIRYARRDGSLRTSVCLDRCPFQRVVPKSLVCRPSRMRLWHRRVVVEDFVLYEQCKYFSTGNPNFTSQCPAPSFPSRYGEAYCLSCCASEHSPLSS